MDRWVSAVVWNAVYKTEINKGKSLLEARNEAQAAVLRTQQPTHTKDQMIIKLVKAVAYGGSFGFGGYTWGHYKKSVGASILRGHQRVFPDRDLILLKLAVPRGFEPLLPG